MLLSLRKNALTSLFKEVRVFKDCPGLAQGFQSLEIPEGSASEGALGNRVLLG